MNSNKSIYIRLNKKTRKRDYSRDGVNYKKKFNDIYSFREKKENVLKKKQKEEELEKEKIIDIWDWYEHYEDLIRILYNNFIYISTDFGLQIKYNQYSFNDFCCMLYNESKNTYLIPKGNFDFLLK